MDFQRSTFQRTSSQHHVIWKICYLDFWNRLLQYFIRFESFRSFQHSSSVATQAINRFCESTVCPFRAFPSPKIQKKRFSVLLFPIQCKLYYCPKRKPFRVCKRVIIVIPLIVSSQNFCLCYLCDIVFGTETQENEVLDALLASNKEKKYNFSVRAVRH